MVGNFKYKTMSDTSLLLLAVGGFLFVFFALPHIMGAAVEKADKEADKGNNGCWKILIFLGFLLFLAVSFVQLKQCH